MADILIRGMEMPKENDILVFDVWHGTVYARSTANIGTRSYEVIPISEGHGELIDRNRKRLDFVPDYKSVRNGIKHIVKETKRDGRAIAGISIELLEQTLVALDELRSVRRYFENAKTIVPAEGGKIE